MKKSILTLAAIALTGFCATFALADSGKPSHDDRTGHYRQGQGQNLTAEEIQARQVFMSDTAPLRQNLAQKVGEYRAVMAADTPDVSAAGKLAGEIAGLKNQLREKAVAAGVHFKGGKGMRMNMGTGDHERGNAHRGNCGW